MIKFWLDNNYILESERGIEFPNQIGKESDDVSTGALISENLRPNEQI